MFKSLTGKVDILFIKLMQIIAHILEVFLIPLTILLPAFAYNKKMQPQEKL